ncbi:hypothetical protein CSUI_007737, partial [Cystoisospora suis]
LDFFALGVGFLVFISLNKKTPLFSFFVKSLLL